MGEGSDAGNAGLSRWESAGRNLSVPTVLRLGPYRFYFYRHEPNEPHVQVDRDDDSAEFWLDAVQLGGN